MSKISFLLILLFVVVLLGPLLTIWSLNTLFPVLAIPYSVETWFAIAIVVSIIRGDGVSFKGK